jgi:uncharacterized membrane protein
MHRLIEMLLGLPHGFLSREGDLSLQFMPRWPLQSVVGASLWNLVLMAALAALVVYVYRREGHTRRLRITLGIIRGLLLGMVLLLLNRPIVSLGQSRTEPSVLAVMVDDSLSMRVHDGGDSRTTAAAEAPSRLEAVQQLLTDHDAALLRELARRHTVRLFRFDSDAEPIAAVSSVGGRTNATAAAQPAAAALRSLQPDGQSTAVLPSILSVLQDLQGQRLAAVVLLTDGRDVPGRPASDALDALKSYGTKVYPIAVGSDAAPRTLEVQSVVAEDTAFKDDLVNVKASIRSSGYERGRPVRVVLKDARTGAVLTGPDGAPAAQTVNLQSGQSASVELQWKATDIGQHELVVEAARQPGELDDSGNARSVSVAVLDAKISVLYVDGYPRWEYRYLKNELLRDKTMTVSCLLTSADADFAQEGSMPITRFPDSIGELMDYDVVVIGDVDPRYFSDQQLQLISDFVSRKGGGFAMVAGPRFSPQAYRGTAIEPVLPVNISRVAAADPDESIPAGFRPVLTPLGADSSIFRFFADRQQNQSYLANDLQPIFWYCRGVVAKPGVGEVYAEHPTDVGPDGHKAALLVLGRFGAGRTLFSAIDDSWRWRFYTGESVFDTYWVQQLRYLARSRKIGQRKLALAAGQSEYELGQPVRLTLRVLDPVLLQQLPDAVSVQVLDAAGEPVATQTLTRAAAGAGTAGTSGGAAPSDLYTGSFTADRVGKFTLRLPPIAASVGMMEAPLEVSLPRLELADPRVDRTSLARLAAETGGKPIHWDTAAAQLLTIPSAEKVIPVVTAQPLWDAPVVMGLFVVLIGAEWVARKMNGMV